ncbi:laminin subunit beta-2-like [Sorex fumeus]|uniref:laminin subunit beta-2-like n=1 Tax=Sorex fumeus TaxID=62283 RepID=UPI0024AC9D39|nr:laminin subunit beta-2-like [Sorex fumeus]
MGQAPRTIAQEVPDIIPPPGCSSGSCYPPTGNLIIGRGQSLRTSSTCGLHGPERYCIVSLLQDSKNCFFCDSQDQGGHSIENVISQSGQNSNRTWWQAESGVENVTIQLDLEGVFHFTQLIMTFKTFRPAALLLERSVDHGRSWHVYRYFAHNCSGLFPGIPSAPGQRGSDLICDQRYSDMEPATEGKVIFKVLDPDVLEETQTKVLDPNNPKIQELLRVTNLRVNFSKLHILGDRSHGSLRGHPYYYYALYELVALGSCLCYGHATECMPAPGAPANVEGMVHGLCVCLHHTAGAHCERCQDLYQDHPWRAAEPGHPHTCRKCECHGHAHSCHFDMALYLASGNVSGGVCDACQHNTAGRHCELCRPFFYRDLQEDLHSPHACRPCDCDPVGALEGGLCDPHTDETLGLLSGQCCCRVHVWGQRCDSCQPGHYGLSPNKAEGCQPCRCDSRGQIPGPHTCDPSSGACHCKRFVFGRDCSRCLPEFWGLSSDSLGCRPCDCDFGGAYSNRCSAREGLCSCRPHLRGRRCQELQSGYFCAALDQATAEAELGQNLQPMDPRLPVSVKLNQQWKDIKTREESVPKLQPPTLVGSDPDFGDSMILKYDIVLRYATQVSDMCARAVVLSGPFCFEPGICYSITLRLWCTRGVRRPAGSTILLDSIVLVPRVSELPGLRTVDRGALGRLQELHKAGCMEATRMGPSSPMPEACSRLICSISVLLHGGALACECHPQGSLSTECVTLGGQCPCRPNIIGRTCDHCMPGTYGFGPIGCSECHCHLKGATSAICNPRNGQCTCRAGLAGRRCDHCLPGRWGFPQCQPCACNGHAEACHPLTGVCQFCHGATVGRHCERCLDGYYGDPTLGSGQRCRPCLCPGPPGSGLYHGSSCHMNNMSGHVVCLCAPGYAASLNSSHCLDIAVTALEQHERLVAGLLPQVTLAMDVTPALEHLSGATVALRTRVALSDRQVQEAEERAVHATSLAGILSKELQVVRSGVTELQEGTQDLMAMMQNARERVQRAQGEAQELMKQMQNSWSHLEGLEQRLAQNERALEEKVATLWALEQQAAELLKHMQLWASAQATC